MEVLHWNEQAVSPELAHALRALGEEYPLVEGDGAPRLDFLHELPAGSLECSRDDSAFRIRYGRLSDALRGVGASLAGLPAAAEGGVLRERCPFATLGIMLDCSRNAVMRVDHVERWMRRLALFGYSMVMLYTEDTYELPGEPLFGAWRGGYTAEELKALDGFAARLGIEMIGCIQTLGHLEQILKWGAYSSVKDTGSILLVDEPGTLALIGKMIDHFATCLSSRRIHVGMDEAHDLGRGRFMDRHGYERRFDIMNRHLADVVAICRERGLKPMIWSDMYFRLGSGRGDYYDLESTIPDDAKKAIPADVDLVYWDYYHKEEDFYAKMFARHRELGRAPIMASGVWTWGDLWYRRDQTESTVAACVAASRKAGIEELFFTLWGDDGGYCEFDSALAGLAFAAEVSYGGEPGEALARRFEAVCGAAYETVLLGSGLADGSLGGKTEEFFAAPGLLWDDPLLGLYWTAMKAKGEDVWAVAGAFFSELAVRLEPHRGTTEPVDLDHAFTLARFLAEKIDFRRRMEAAYDAREGKALEELADDARRLAGMVEELEGTFRRQWYRRNKPFGFEVLQIRLGGQRQRFLETARRLEGIAAGEASAIPELDEASRIPAEAARHLAQKSFRRLGTASCIL